MPEDEQASVDSLLQQIEENAESEKLSLDKYVAKTYGKGMNYELLKTVSYTHLNYRYTVKTADGDRTVQMGSGREESDHR